MSRCFSSSRQNKHTLCNRLTEEVRLHKHLIMSTENLLVGQVLALPNLVLVQVRLTSSGPTTLACQRNHLTSEGSKNYLDSWTFAIGRTTLASSRQA